MTDFVTATYSANPVPALIDRRKIYLQAGQLTAVTEPSVIITILGSCVAICLWDARLHIGGMNHYMLPFHGKEAGAARFGNVAWEQLLNRLTRLGSLCRDLRAGIFGGACVMETFRNADHIGKRNAELAETLVTQSGVAIVQRDLEGRQGRKVTFETDTGHVTIRRL
ncbi:MAG TPA: chemotaxis protein CheD [Thermoanaerobaculia bacterium]|nr:chemotaxis protein CheD [Thermoanaerobaculia bacterium]